MRNVLRLVKRDLLRLAKVPAAWVICVGLVVIPSLYAWVNIYGFWDPYGNTSKIQVAVANEDKGTTNDLLGKLNLGDQIVQAMKSNTQLGWHYVSREQALDEVRSGKSYAAFVIPKDFSKDLATLLSGDFQQPKLQYYVNEKANAVAPKITDVGSTTLDTTINNTFVSTASQVIVSQLNGKLDDASQKITQAQTDASGSLDSTVDKLDTARNSIKDLHDTVDKAKAKAQNAKSTLADVETQTGLLTDGLKQTSSLLTSTGDSINTFAANASGTLDKGSSLISTTSSKANVSVGKVAGTITTASGTVAGAIETGKSITDQNAQTISSLESVINTLPADSQLRTRLNEIVNGKTGSAGLKQRNQSLAQTLNNLDTINTDTVNTANTVAGATDTLDTTVQNTLNNVNDYRGTLTGTTIPQINSGLTQLAGVTGNLAGGITSQSNLLDQTDTILDQLSSTLDATGKALDQTDAGIKTLRDDVDTVRTDVNALVDSDAWSKITSGGKLDAEKISDFMFSPTTLKTTTLYPINSYGSGMAPLFTDLSLWVGAFVLMVIVKLEVDDEGIAGLTVRQAYMGRWLLLAILAVLQAIVCCVGDLIIGVQAANVPAFIGTGVITSLTYLSITYALSVTFQHVGKALCVVLVIVQIPGASGLYPIEMMPGFFRRLYPFFPFTYSIDAIRETIGGFYDGLYANAVGHLLLFVAASFILGLVLRPYLTNLNRLFAKEIEESDIIIGEQAEVPFRTYRFSQAMRAMADHAGYRTGVHRRAMRFAHHYPRLKLGGLIAGFVVPFALTLLFSLNPAFEDTSRKAVMLGAWVTWVLIIIGFLIAIEYIRDNIERQMRLGAMSDDEIRDLFSMRKYLKTIPLPSFGLPVRPVRTAAGGGRHGGGAASGTTSGPAAGDGTSGNDTHTNSAN
ncbi:YhgE/Pip domain-containing protein [Bifidobacterium vansinderenii]|uniref:ABC-2 family transporter protein n=1 Tax=Bifidobacterium vansinderenii TaxID=1984871 RepID=A0A229VYQ2_9BIFI|nr:YhgE/Pip domain-containing protein [Bifidobacterium vansinderenii]OXN00686.1 ABC-2 family transporter protein [Bifidobacterium vansinderenii]